MTSRPQPVPDVAPPPSRYEWIDDHLIDVRTGREFLFPPAMAVLLREKIGSSGPSEVFPYPTDGVARSAGGNGEEEPQVSFVQPTAQGALQEINMEAPKGPAEQPAAVRSLFKPPEGVQPIDGQYYYTATGRPFPYGPLPAANPREVPPEVSTKAEAPYSFYPPNGSPRTITLELGEAEPNQSDKPPSADHEAVEPARDLPSFVTPSRGAERYEWIDGKFYDRDASPVLPSLPREPDPAPENSEGKNQKPAVSDPAGERPSGFLDAVARAALRGWQAGETAVEMSMGTATPESIAERQRLSGFLRPTEDFETTWDDGKSAKESFGAFIRDPLGNLAQLTAESLGTMARTSWHFAGKIPERATQGTVGAVTAGAIGGGPAGAAAMVLPGALVGGSAGMAEMTMLASHAAEYSGSFLDALQESGVDVQDEESLRQAMSDKDLMARVRASAERKAVPVGIVDGLMTAIGGRLFSSPAKKVLGKAGQWAMELGVQGLAGMGGEAAGQLNQKGKISSPRSIIAEGVGEIGGSGAEVAAGRISQGARILNDTAGRRATAPSEDNSTMARGLAEQRNFAIRRLLEGKSKGISMAELLGPYASGASDPDSNLINLSKHAGEITAGDGRAPQNSLSGESPFFKLSAKDEQIEGPRRRDGGNPRGDEAAGAIASTLARRIEALGVGFIWDEKISGRPDVGVTDYGKITVFANPSLTLKWDQTAREAGIDAGEAIRLLLGEELVHVATYVSYKREWISLGRPGDFREFYAAGIRDVYDDIGRTIETVPSDTAHRLKQALLDSYNVYFSKFAKGSQQFQGSVETILKELPNEHAVEFVSEFLRQAIQFKRDGRINEDTHVRIRRYLQDLALWVQGVIRRLKLVLPEIEEGAFGPRAKETLARIEKTLDEYHVTKDPASPF